MNQDETMLTMGIDEMAQAVSGHVFGETASGIEATSVTTDSRQVRPGSVFVAIAGERVDGHDFVAQAADRGAVAAVVEHVVPDTAIAQIVVDNSVQALGALARHNIDRRRELSAAFSIIGITGSVGKTTTKDLLHALLADIGVTVAPVGSFNNDIGLPLTALQVNASTRFLIAEMGANHVGEIANLTTIAPPDVSVVLKVGTAHLGEFGSVERIAQAKSEIVRGLLPHGLAVLNADDAHVSAMAALAPGAIRWFGEGELPADAQGLTARDIAADDQDHPTFEILDREDGDRARVHLAIAGRHNVYNALAAASVARHFGMSLSRIADILRDVTLISPHRMAVSTVRGDGFGFTMIDDSFNANPDSMKAGLDGLAAWRGDGESEHYRIAVLGAMLELGDDEDRLHREMGAYAVRSGADAVIAVGADHDTHLDGLAAALSQGARQARDGSGADVSIDLVHDVDAAERVIGEYAGAHHHAVVLIKGSHASGLGALVRRWPSAGVPSKA